MKVDEMITLEDGNNYGLIYESELNNEKYFLATLLNEQEEPTNNFKVFKEMKKDNELFVLEEKDPLILNSLLTDYKFQLDDED